MFGDATACGGITSSVTGTPLPGVNTAAPPVIPLPAFTFDPANYPGINCFPSVPSCDESNTSATAVSTANVAIDAVRTNMSGVWAVWQTSPTQSTLLDLEDLVLAGDTTIVTNAPVDFDNTTSIELAAGAAPPPAPPRSFLTERGEFDRAPEGASDSAGPGSPTPRAPPLANCARRGENSIRHSGVSRGTSERSVGGDGLRRRYCVAVPAGAGPERYACVTGLPSQRAGTGMPRDAASRMM